MISLASIVVVVFSSWRPIEKVLWYRPTLTYIRQEMMDFQPKKKKKTCIADEGECKVVRGLRNDKYHSWTPVHKHLPLLYLCYWSSNHGYRAKQEIKVSMVDLCNRGKLQVFMIQDPVVSEIIILKMLCGDIISCINFFFR